MPTEKIALHTQHDAATVVAEVVALRARPDRTPDETARMEHLSSLRKRMLASLLRVASPTEAEKAALALLKRRIR